MLYRIYLVLHMQSGRVYIGQTSRTVSERWKQHLWRSCNPRADRFHLHNAINAYGRDAFTCYELTQCASKDEVNELERALIAEHDSMNPTRGFNCTVGGEGTTRAYCRRGHDISTPDTRNKWSHCLLCYAIPQPERAKAPVIRVKSRQLYCKRGHERALHSRTNGSCAVCYLEREQRRHDQLLTSRNYLAVAALRKEHCKRGHDRTLPGALNAFGVCVACERERSLRRNYLRPIDAKIVKLLCNQGHDRTRPNAIDKRGHCRECKREYNARVRAQKVAA